MPDEKEGLPYIPNATFTCTHIKGTEDLWKQDIEIVAKELAKILKETVNIYKISLKVGHAVHLTVLNQKDFPPLSTNDIKSNQIHRRG